MAIQHVSGLDVGNVPNGSIEQIQDTIVNNSAGTPYDQMSDTEKAAYRARKAAQEEESNPELMRAMGRDIITPRVTEENLKKLFNQKNTSVSSGKTFTPKTVVTQDSPPPQADVVVRKRATHASPMMTAEKD